MEEPDLVSVYLKKKFGEVSAQVPKTPLLSDKHYLFLVIIQWDMSYPLKVSVKLILITRGKAAMRAASQGSAHHLSLQLNLCCQEQLAVLEGRDKKQVANASLQQWKNPQDPPQRKCCFKRTALDVALMSPKFTSPNHDRLVTYRDRVFVETPISRHLLGEN